MGAPSLKPGEELCDKCRKVISKRAHKHIWREKIVCSTCRNALRHEAGIQELRSGPPTEGQLQYAVDLGILPPVGATYGQISNEISRIQKREAGKEERARLRAWVYSVAMHMTGSRWVIWRDSKLGMRDMDRVVRELRRSPDIIEYIDNVDTGDEPDWLSALAIDRDLNPDEEWYWFDVGGEHQTPDEDYPTSRSAAYQETARLLTVHLADALRAAPQITLPKDERDRFGLDVYAPELAPTRTPRRAGCLTVVLLGGLLLSIYWLA